MLGERGRGIVECSPRFDGDGPAEPRVESELAWMQAVARASGRPVTFNLSQTRDQGDHYRLALRLVADAAAEGLVIRPQTTGKSVGVVFTLGSSTPFDRFGAWAELRGRPAAEKLAALRDPTQRDRLVADAADAWAGMDAFFLVDGDPFVRLDNDPVNSLEALARARGTTPVQVWVDACLATDGRAALQWPLLNQDVDAIEELITNPTVVMGLADAGAHVGQIIDASQPSYLLTYWVRERKVLTLEDGVHKLSGQTAAFVGSRRSRGLAAGRVRRRERDRLGRARRSSCPSTCTTSRTARAGSIQRSRGYDATIVNGRRLARARRAHRRVRRHGAALRSRRPLTASRGPVVAICP